MAQRYFFLCVLLLLCTATNATAFSVRTDTPSGYPVPRFVSVNSAGARCRIGPSLDHPTAFKLMKRGAPFMVVAETVNDWLKLRDIDGQECWTYAPLLRAPTHAYTLRQATLRHRPDDAAKVRAIVNTHVLLKVENIDGEWVRLSADKRHGWIHRDDLWGVKGSASAHFANAK